MEYPDNTLGGSETAHLQATASTTPKDELIGVTLDGRYLIERKLGQGGFGIVYLASDEKIVSRKVVVKVMRAQETDNEWSKKKFKQEIEALTRINHPSIVGVLDSGETSDGKPYIVMQYVNGVSLRSLITREGMPFSRAANIISQMGRALSAAHRCGILHRDLKPENVMLEELNESDEHVKIIDFGVAKIRNSTIPLSTARDQTVGTIAYMSPEQLKAQPLTSASDIYAMGVIAYEMLTGRRPTNPDSAFQLLELQRSSLLIKPTDLRPSLPQTAESIILKALSFEPSDRYQSVRDFGDLLSSSLIGHDEQPELETQRQERGEGAENFSLETAHVLFMDIVGYSKLLIDQQTERLKLLQEIVLAAADCRRARKDKELIRLPTGDGMALSFFDDPEAPVRCAVEVSRALRDHPEIKLRMGVHSGLVYRIADINANMNVAGGGINMAQRVMDCGDAGHILLSKRVADDLGQLSRWVTALHDLGEAEVKHGVRVHIYNLYNDEIGNAEVPAKLRRPEPQPGKIKRWLAVAGAVVIVLGGVFFWSRNLMKVERTRTQNSVTNPNAVSERVFTYFLIPSDRTRNLEEQRFTGNEQFHNGSKFRFVLIPEQSGALYLLDKGIGPNKRTAWNVLFPTPKNNNGSSALAANQRMEAGINFDSNPGDEYLSIIWSAQPIPELETICKDAAKTDFEIKNPTQIETINAFLTKHESPAPKAEIDNGKKQTTVRGQGYILIYKGNEKDKELVLKHTNF